MHTFSAYRLDNINSRIYECVDTVPVRNHFPLFNRSALRLVLALHHSNYKADRPDYFALRMCMRNLNNS